MTTCKLRSVAIHNYVMYYNDYSIRVEDKDAFGFYVGDNLHTRMIINFEDMYNSIGSEVLCYNHRAGIPQEFQGIVFQNGWIPSTGKYLIGTNDFTNIIKRSAHNFIRPDSEYKMKVNTSNITATRHPMVYKEHIVRQYTINIFLGLDDFSYRPPYPVLAWHQNTADRMYGNQIKSVVIDHVASYRYGR